MKRFINNTKSAAGSAQRKLLPVAVTAAMLLVAVVPSDVLAMGPSSFGPQFETRPGAPTHDFSFDFESTSESCSGDEEPSFNARLVPNETLDCGEDFEDCFELPSEELLENVPGINFPNPTLHRVMAPSRRGWLNPSHPGNPMKDWLAVDGPLVQSKDVQFRFWSEEGVDKERQSRTYIATFPDQEPDRSDVRHVVFTLSGQQQTDIWMPNVENSTRLTGQSGKWREDFDARPPELENEEGVIYFDEPEFAIEDTSWSKENGLPKLLLMKDRGDGTPLRDLEDTFVAMAYDHQYNWETVKGQRTKVKNAFLRWLQSKFDADKIETVFLAGHSRGGCLAARLGQDLAKALPADVKIMVQVHDGVCKNKELGKYVGPFTDSGKKIWNPLNDKDDYKAAKADVQWELDQLKFRLYARLMTFAEYQKKRGELMPDKFKASPTNFDKTFRRPLWDDSGWMSLKALVTSRNVRIVNFVSGGPGPMDVNAMTHSDELATSFEVLRHGIPLVRQQWRTESHGGLAGAAVDDGWRHAVQMCDELCC